VAGADSEMFGYNIVGGSFVVVVVGLRVQEDGGEMGGMWEVEVIRAEVKWSDKAFSTATAPAPTIGRRIDRNSSMHKQSDAFTGESPWQCGTIGSMNWFVSAA
jgi:hypothetical protein